MGSINKKWELWFDGGHNKSASNALSKTLRSWKYKDLYLIFGMLNSKNPKEFLNNFKNIKICCVCFNSSA